MFWNFLHTLKLPVYWRKSFLKKSDISVKLDKCERVHGVIMIPLFILKAAALMSWNWTTFGLAGSHIGSNKTSSLTAMPLAGGCSVRMRGTSVGMVSILPEVSGVRGAWIESIIVCSSSPGWIKWNSICCCCCRVCVKGRCCRLGDEVLIMDFSGEERGDETVPAATRNGDWLTEPKESVTTEFDGERDPSLQMSSTGNDESSSTNSTLYKKRKINKNSSLLFANAQII